MVHLAHSFHKYSEEHAMASENRGCVLKIKMDIEEDIISPVYSQICTEIRN